MTKKWYKSKTLITNILLFILAMIQSATGQSWFSPDLQVVAIAIINALLRFITKDKIVS
ncbi:MAG TPA: hypothetical protein VIK78_14410 [Ruminiclostridium sp.]